MTDCISYPAVSHPPKRRWLIPAIIGGAIVAGIAGVVDHQPEPVSCEPGSTRVVIAQPVTSSTLPDVEMCWRSAPR